MGAAPDDNARGHPARDAGERGDAERDADTDAAPLEIERSYLLRAMPPLPTDETGAIDGTVVEVLRIAQGYLPDDAKSTLGVEGRLRRLEHVDGRVELRHTVKTGFGLVRTEVERSIDAAEFNRLWPHTAGRRLTKTRHRIRAGDFAWEIDRFHEVDLVLAEVELPSATTVAPIPSWLAPLVVREVTDEPEYRNSQIALRVWDAARRSNASG
ncbi:MAG: hypothetical protein U0575_00315 [Phycisphaerales bacterium]|jgi:CYTH domain-containing protein